MKNSKIKWVIWALCSLFYFYEFILRVSPSVLVFELMQSFNITASAVGVLSAFYLYAYAPMQLPVGVIIDHFGIKKVLSIASIVCGIGAIIFASTKFFSLAAFGRLLIGTGSSFAFVAVLYITSHWFTFKKRAFLVGTANSLAMLGASSGAGPLSVIIKNLGWRLTINIFGFFGIILGIIIFYILKIDKKTEQIEKQTEKAKIKILQNLKIVASKPNNWTNSLVALLFYITTTTFAGLWGIAFIQTAYKVPKEIASFAVSMVFTGWVIGGPLIGFISDFIGKRKNTIRIGLLASLLCLIPVIYFPTIHIYLVYILLFLVGLFSSAELLNFSLAMETNSLQVRATAAAFTNFLISCGDGISQSLVGFLLDFNWTGEIINSIRIYSTANYQIALSCLPIGLALGFIVLFFVKEK